MNNSQEKRQREFWKKIKIKYRVSAINESTLEEVWRIKASLFMGLLLFIGSGILLVFLTSLVIIATPIRYYLPGYMDAEIRDQAIKSAIRIDSLEHALAINGVYINNVHNILTGVYEADTLNSRAAILAGADSLVIDSSSISEKDPRLGRSAIESDFISKYEESEKYTLGVFSPKSSSIGITFFRPMRGNVIKPFDEKESRPYIEILAAQSQPVLSVADGTVIFASYDVANGNVIQIQHKNGFISVYMGCTSLVKKQGDVVTIGQAIGQMEVAEKTKSSNKTDLSNDDKPAILKFELWDKGKAVNPESYINF